MSSSSNLFIADLRADGRRARRTALRAMLAAGLAGLGGWPMQALAGADSADPAALAAHLAGLRRWGRGQYRRFGFLVYEATLWAGSDPTRPPLALRLDYQRAIAGADITEASVAEMRRLGADAVKLARWRMQMARLFPDVQPGDYILGLYHAESAVFVHNGRALGAIEDAEFARSFFAIWLDPRSSAPELRAALLGLPAN